MITPNQLEEAKAELSKIHLGSFVIPREIQEKGSKNHYQCIGVRAKDSKDGFSKDYYCKKLSCDINQWNKMGRQIKQGVFKRYFADVFTKIVILHNPTKPTKKVKPKVKGLSPKQKGEVKELLEGDAFINSEAIAEKVGVSIERIEAFLNK